MCIPQSIYIINGSCHSPQRHELPRRSRRGSSACDGYVSPPFKPPVYPHQMQSGWPFLEISGRLLPRVTVPKAPPQSREPSLAAAYHAVTQLLIDTDHLRLFSIMSWLLCSMTLSILKRFHHLKSPYIVLKTSFPVLLGFLTKKM